MNIEDTKQKRRLAVKKYRDNNKDKCHDYEVKRCKENKARFYCQICDIGCTALNKLMLHEKTKKHMKRENNAIPDVKENFDVVKKS